MPRRPKTYFYPDQLQKHSTQAHGSGAVAITIDRPKNKTPKKRRPKQFQQRTKKAKPLGAALIYGPKKKKKNEVERGNGSSGPRVFGCFTYRIVSACPTVLIVGAVRVYTTTNATSPRAAGTVPCIAYHPPYGTVLSHASAHL